MVTFPIKRFGTTSPRVTEIQLDQLARGISAISIPDSILAFKNLLRTQGSSVGNALAGRVALGARLSFQKMFYEMQNNL